MLSDKPLMASFISKSVLNSPASLPLIGNGCQRGLIAEQQLGKGLFRGRILLMRKGHDRIMGTVIGDSYFLFHFLFHDHIRPSAARRLLYTLVRLADCASPVLVIGTQWPVLGVPAGRGNARSMYLNAIKQTGYVQPSLIFQQKYCCPIFSNVSSTNLS